MKRTSKVNSKFYGLMKIGSDTLLRIDHDNTDEPYALSTDKDYKVFGVSSLEKAIYAKYNPPSYWGTSEDNPFHKYSPDELSIVYVEREEVIVEDIREVDEGFKPINIKPKSNTFLLFPEKWDGKVTSCLPIKYCRSINILAIDEGDRYKLLRMEINGRNFTFYSCKYTFNKEDWEVI